MQHAGRTSRAHVSLARALSKLGVASRTAARNLIAEKAVTVNGKTAVDPDLWIDLRVDRIAVRGVGVRAAALQYVMMHKPAGIVTTRSDERGRKTVCDLLPAAWKKLFPVGRLDKDTSGLLLFTNDTAFGEMLTNPERRLAKTYLVETGRTLDTRDRVIMESGQRLPDGTLLRPVIIAATKQERTYAVTITEGKNRQIRRMFSALEYDVVSLHRRSIGSVVLHGLNPGECRALTSSEVASLRRKEG